MKQHFLRGAALALALSAGIGFAIAQTSGALQLSEAQKSTIYKTLKVESAGIGEEVQPALTAKEHFRVGATVPQDMKLLDIPSATEAQVPAVQGYKYTVVGEEVGLVDPNDRRIVMILN